jgi:hypothetical protein
LLKKLAAADRKCGEFGMIGHNSTCASRGVL